MFPEIRPQSVQLPESNPQLCQIIADQIRKSVNQKISFAEFMELALYHPQHGYYATNRNQAGIQSDFFTSPHLGRDFGELLAIQFAELWENLNRPHPFTLVEMGAGQGLLVADIVRYLHRHHFECFEALEYIIIEKSAALIVEQQNRLKSLTQSWAGLQWRNWDEIPSASIVGCFFSNELVDAFPVQLIQAEAHQLQELYVSIDRIGVDKARLAKVEQTEEKSAGEGQAINWVESALSASAQIQQYFQLIDIDLLSDRYPKPYRTEVNLAALDWITTIADRLQRGYILTIDYGYSAERYYSRTRSEGTLQCYYQHRHHNDPYRAIGLQDITTHANFTALERQGEKLGLQTAGFTQQGLFLMALGLGDRLNALSRPNDFTVQEILQRRETLHALIDPAGLGNFGVLLQSKAVTDGSLQGFTVPPLFSELT